MKTTSDDGIEFSIRFSNHESIFDVFDRLDMMKSAYKYKTYIRHIRTICQTDDGRIFYPTSESNLPTARWAFVSTAASFPIGVPVDFILKNTGLTSNGLSSYCTSKKNPSHKYFFMDSGLLHVLPEGIGWVYKNLKKDKQIEELEGDDSN